MLNYSGVDNKSIALRWNRRDERLQNVVLVMVKKDGNNSSRTA